MENFAKEPKQVQFLRGQIEGPSLWRLKNLWSAFDARNAQLRSCVLGALPRNTLIALQCT